MYLRMLIVLGASLYTVRVTLNALGVEDLGIYGIAGGMVTLFAFLNATMTRAGQRFLGIEIGRNDPVALNKTFNAVLAANFAIAVFVVILSTTLGFWLLNHKLSIPTHRLPAANIVLAYSIATTVAMIMCTPYSALIISRQKMWFFTIISVLDALLKLAVAFLIAHSTHDRLTLYAALMCGTSWTLLLCYILFSRTNFPESKLAIHADRPLYGELLSFTSWSFIGNLAHVLRTQGVNMLLNVFHGTSLNAAHGVMTQAQGAATQFTSSTELALSPQIYRSYGEGDMAAVRSMVFTGAKLNYMMLAVLVAPALYGMDYILYFWLDKHLAYLSEFVSWMLLAQLIETLSQPLMVAAFATGNIKRYQLAVGGTILLNLPFTWFAFKLGASPPTFLYVAFGIQLAAFSLRVCLLRTMIKLDIKSFLHEVVLRLLVISAVAAALIFLVKSVLPTPSTFAELLAGSTLISLPLVVVCAIVGLNANERRLLNEKFLKRILKGKRA